MQLPRASFAGVEFPLEGRFSIPADFRRALMSSDTSRQNKMWLAASWSQRFFVEWRWQGAPMRSRMAFRFEPGSEFAEAKSFDEDIVPTFEFGSGKSGKAAK